ncbi:MAG: nucleotidyltransferase family protein [Oscillospiraceae bacterium]|nr:nucleotidyltransferase family protein [Oscillospiraceae bacterium]
MDMQLALFLALLRAGILGEGPALAPFADRWAEIRPAEIRDLALRHDVLVTVYTALDGAEEPALCQLKKELKRIYAPRFAKAMNQDCEGTALLDAFEEAGVDCIPLKGWSIRRLYADPLSRSMSDLDILVRDYGHARMMRLMEELGYTGESLSAWKHENYRKDPYMKVELHRRLTDDVGAARDWEARMWSRCRPAEGCTHVFEMAPEDLCVHHLLHMREDFTHGTLGFRRIADLWLLQRKYPDLDRALLERELASLDLGPFTRKMESLAAVCFEDLSADEDTEVLLRFASDNSISGAKKTYQLGRMAMMSRGGLRSARLRSIWNAIFLPYERMRAQYPAIEEHPILLPFCWAKRLLGLALSPEHYWKRLKSADITEEDLDEMRRVLRAGGVLPQEGGGEES